MNQRFEREQESPRDSFTSVLTYILDKEKDWDESLGDLGEVHLAKLLYEFSKNPSPDQTKTLTETATWTEDETLLDHIKNIKDLLAEGEDMYGNYLEALKYLITDIKSWAPARNAAAIRVARKIGDWKELTPSVSYIEVLIAQLYDSDQAQWAQAIVQISKFYQARNSSFEVQTVTNREVISANDPRLNPFRDFINSLNIDDFGKGRGNE